MTQDDFVLYGGYNELPKIRSTREAGCLIEFHVLSKVVTEGGELNCGEKRYPHGPEKDKYGLKSLLHGEEENSRHQTGDNPGLAAGKNHDAEAKRAKPKWPAAPAGLVQHQTDHGESTCNP